MICKDYLLTRLQIAWFSKLRTFPGGGDEWRHKQIFNYFTLSSPPTPPPPPEFLMLALVYLQSFGRFGEQLMIS